jgi:transcriptional regulator with XRE-family HTH domain
VLASLDRPLAIVSSLRYIAGVSKSKQQEAEDATGLPERSDNEVGSFIREQRERANLSLRRLAERAGVSNPYLSQIERGIRNPSAEILKRLSRALEISAETLYTRAGLIEDGPAAPTVVEAIESDRRLTPRQKQVVLDLYRALVEAGAAADEPNE